MSTNKTMSWGWTVFWLILFWPIGIFFLFKKLSGDKTATLKSSKTVSIISYVLMGMGVIYLLMAFSEDSSMFVAALLFGGGGIWVNRVAKKMKVNGKKYKKYINLVVNQSMTQIDNIASAVGVSYNVAMVDLEKMIDTGYFAGAYINEGSREIVLVKNVEATMAQPMAVHAQTRFVVCRSCGANNSVITGQIKECEYCGSPVE